MIVKTEITTQSVVITLQNGVVLHISDNSDMREPYLHIGFSGITLPLVANSFSHTVLSDEEKRLSLELANYVNLFYRPSRESKGNGDNQ